ncbi:MAG TPA: hypothetical protein DD490_20795 [Acidobacteria bacterium]|nr:hypothetical protein [Acidobacteriota bacterium]
MKYASLLFVALFSALPLASQVTASQPTPEQIREMTGAPQELCPLLLEINLARTEKKRAIADLPTPGSWIENRGLSRYVCDKAQVRSVSLLREREKKGKVLLVASPRLTTGWMRQDVNVTVQLIVNGEVKLSEKWEELTIGTEEGAAAALGMWGTSSSKAPKTEWWVPAEDLQSWFGDGNEVKLRLLLEIEE